MAFSRKVPSRRKTKTEWDIAVAREQMHELNDKLDALVDILDDQGLISKKQWQIRLGRNRELR